eukprot:scaffold290793_cov20-Tisochrysis_lutea.AAC.1
MLIAFEYLSISIPTLLSQLIMGWNVMIYGIHRRMKMHLIKVSSRFGKLLERVLPVGAGEEVGTI